MKLADNLDAVVLLACTDLFLSSRDFRRSLSFLSLAPIKSGATDLTYLGLLLQVERIYFLKFSFLRSLRQVTKLKDRDATDQSEEKRCFIRL